VRLTLAVDDLTTSMGFYRDVLGLEPLVVDLRRAVMRTGTVPIMLEKRDHAVDGRRIRRSGYLLVFHTPEIDGTCAHLRSAGVTFSGVRVSSTAPGRTARFADPSGHQLCLYEPSEQALSWSSGQKVRELVGDSR
jgi:catechol 2,3-dioxygenase-like lactoylglutathione lyase family enzyme